MGALVTKWVAERAGRRSGLGIAAGIAIIGCLLEAMAKPLKVAHVCVLQTVLEMQAAGKQVFVVEEAVGSRRESDKALALTRMRDAGATIVSREMVAFEWLRRADSELFREISKNFLR